MFTALYSPDSYRQTLSFRWLIAYSALFSRATDSASVCLRESLKEALKLCGSGYHFHDHSSFI